MKSWFLHHVSIPEVIAERIAGFHRTPTTRHRRSFLSPLDPIIDVVRIASRLTLAGPSLRRPKPTAVPASCESTGAEGASTVSFGSCGSFMARSSVSLRVCCPRISAEAIEIPDRSPITRSSTITLVCNRLHNEESCIRRADACNGLAQAGSGPSDTIPLN